VRALAAFIMRGRTQAAVAALLGNWVPLLTPATVALVTLRLGMRQGSLIMLWGLLPAVLTLSFSQLNPLMPLIMVGSVLLACAAASVLRATASWAHTLMGVVAASTLIALVLMLLVPEAVAAATHALAEVLSQLQEQAQNPAELFVPGPAFVLGLAAYGIALGVILGLLVGRWWQALLYNPGGFAQEFRQLRLSVVQGVVCMGAGVYALLQGSEYGIWGALFTLPLTFAGLALMHGLVAQRGLGVQWLVLLYVALVLFNPVSQLLVAVAFIDTWLNFRGRLRPKQ
jgi:hypothetical protein